MRPAAAAALLLAGCAAADVSPAALADAALPPAERAERAAALARWHEGMHLANRFLASGFRRTLPPGRFALGEDGMTFETGERTLPIRVRCTSWGDLCLLTGFAAQERSWGFVVGRQAPARDRALDNSLLREESGALAAPERIAALALHETTHVWCGDGTVGFWRGAAYYLEAALLFRYENHSAERRANATSREFSAFLRARPPAGSGTR